MSKVLQLFRGARPLLLATVLVFLGILFLGLHSQTAYAANPNLINFQGKVVNADGTNVSNGSYTFRFRLYTSTSPTDAANACSANSCKWEESKSVTVTNGVFQTELGDTTTMIDVSAYTDLYLGVKFNGDAAGEMAPRVHLDSVPYALNADKVGGVAASGLVQLGATQSGNINISSGTITSGLINGQTISSSGNFTGTLNVQGASALTLGTATSAPGAIIFNTGGANTITLQGPTSNPGSAYVLKLPTTAPALSQCLQNDGTTIGQLTFATCDPSSGDNISVNGSSATDANFLDTTSSGTVTGVTFTLATVPNPDTIALTIANASVSAAGSVTNASQTFAGDKAFQSTGNSATAFQIQNSGGVGFLNVNAATQQLQVRNLTDTASLGSELITISDFTNAAWTKTGWSVTSTVATHTAGNTNVLSTTQITVVAGNYYLISMCALGSPPAGETVTPGIGGGSGRAIEGNCSTFTEVVKATTTGALTFTPTSSYNGNIQNISVKLLTLNTSALAVLDSAGTTRLEVRATSQITAVGLGAAQSSTTGSALTAFGTNSLASNTTGGNNTAVGRSSLTSNTSGSSNTAVGDGALLSNVNGSNNTATGASALTSNTTGFGNTAYGYNALYSNTSGSNNTALGYEAGHQDPNVGTFVTLTNLQNATAIGYGSQVQLSNSLILGGQDANAVNVGIGTTSPTNTFSVSPDVYDTGTASTTASATVVGSGTTWTISMVGMEFIFANGNKYTITGFTDTTHLTLSASSTNASQAYRIHNPAFFVSSTGQTQVRTSTNSTTAFQVQNAAGTAVLNVDTTDTNLLSNPGFEVSASLWTAANTTAPTRDTTNKYLGFGSGTVAGVTTAGEGFKQIIPTTLANGTYTISWYDKMVSGPAFTDVMAALSTTGGAPTNCTGINSQTVVSTGWTRHWCQVTASSDTSANYITIRQVGVSTSRTWNIDGAQLELGATVTAYGAGTIMINSNIISPINLKNIEDSTTAFQVQTANGTNLATFDTLNSGITFEGDVTLNSQRDLRFADSDSSNWVAFQAAATVAGNVTWTLPSADSAGCFKSDGSGTMSISTCGDVKTEAITSTSTWNKPTGAIVEIVELWGGGGSGGAGQAANSLAAAKLGGGAGGGGAYNTASFNASNIGSSVPVTIGAGGVGGTGVANGNGNAGNPGGQTCFSTTTSCAGTMYITAFGGGSGAATGVGNGGGGGGGIQGVGANAATTTGGAGGAPLGAAVSTAHSGFGGAGGVSAIAAPAAAGAGSWGGGGGGASSTTAASNSGPGGGSNHGGGGGGGGGGCAITTCTVRAGGAGGVAGNAATGSAGGSTAGQAGTAGVAGIGFGGGGGGGGASNFVAGGSTGGVGGAGGTQGGGGGGGGAATSTSGTSTGGAGGAGGRGEIRITTIKGTGADLAEIYSTKDTSIGPGDVVSLDPTLKAGVKKSSKAYDSTAFGIISTTPSLVMGSIEDEGTVPAIVALSGRVPTKVNLQNGPIKAGDFLTPSSTPGVAMKATKAGQVIGQAMVGFDGTVGMNGDKTGLIVAFVKNQVGNGSTLSDLITGLPTIDDGSAVPDLSKLALAQLVTTKDQLGAAVDLSEITTDRVMAGLEVITPSVVTDALSTNSIGSSGGGDITFLLDAHNKLVVKGKSGGPGFSVDATGNAVFGVSLVSLGDIESKGGLTVDGDALFNGKSTFAKLAQFQGDIDAQGRVTFNKDAGGLALLAKGGTRVDVTFDKAYDRPPVVAVTLIADQVTLPNGTVEDTKLKEQRLFNAGYSYLVSNSSTKGFTIVLNKKADENLQFSWNAVAIKDPGTTVGQTDNTDTPADPQPVDTGEQQ